MADQPQPTPTQPAHVPLNRQRLIAPGPVEVEPRVLAQLAQPQMHHRAPEGVAKLMQARAQLSELLDAPGYESVIVTGSGTAAFEGALVSLVPGGAKVVSAQAGKFSERWGEMAGRFGYDTHLVSRPWGEVLDPQEVADAARDAHTLLVTHSETSTGALHDLQAITAAAKARNPDLIVIADCITSYGVAELRPDAWGVDVIVSGSQKGTATPPGLGLLLFSPEVQERLIPNTPRGFYLDMQRELKGQKAGNTPQTPAINLIYALSASLERLLSVPREVLWAEKRRQNDALLAAGTAIGARPWASRTSPAVAVLCPPEGLGGRAVAAQLAAMGQRALPGQAPHEDTVFRVSNMGYADRYDALAIAGVMEDAFEALGVTFTRGAGVAAAWEALKG
ncbi:aminotransferase class V-fold PLP-dependent enzyme [Deinococcus aquiradiocola]|uniref:Aminotransferase V n=1 Tax=Deinococcus aquiradiocola TaxID=393059 RepID=A0A917UKB7_9DEIO|nr:aminotransferase class V-fold PLP-dependent enzyme [Deinococcus aquiradiocola]GGJ63504.1 aminotransferase V [Deinococcus aquiradiocola]